MLGADAGEVAGVGVPEEARGSGERGVLEEDAEEVGLALDDGVDLGRADAADVLLDHVEPLVRVDEAEVEVAEAHLLPGEDGVGVLAAAGVAHEGLALERVAAEAVAGVEALEHLDRGVGAEDEDVARGAAVEDAGDRERPRDERDRVVRGGDGAVDERLRQVRADVEDELGAAERDEGDADAGEHRVRREGREGDVRGARDVEGVGVVEGGGVAALEAPGLRGDGEGRLGGGGRSGRGPLLARRDGRSGRRAAGADEQPCRSDEDAQPHGGRLRTTSPASRRGEPPRSGPALAMVGGCAPRSSARWASWR